MNKKNHTDACRKKKRETVNNIFVPPRKDQKTLKKTGKSSAKSQGWMPVPIGEKKWGGGCRTTKKKKHFNKKRNKPRQITS